MKCVARPTRAGDGGSQNARPIAWRILDQTNQKSLALILWTSTFLNVIE